mgnify:CR=1 FL=1
MFILFVCFCIFQELIEWNARYLQKFGIVFLIFASGRTTLEILAEMKVKFESYKAISFCSRVYFLLQNLLTQFSSINWRNFLNNLLCVREFKGKAKGKKCDGEKKKERN